MSTTAQELVEKVLSKYRNDILVNTKDNIEDAQNKLMELDNAIKPVLLDMYYKKGGEYTMDRAYRRALRIFNANKDTKSRAEKLAQYLKVRWAAFKEGLTGNELFRREVNETGKALGELKPVTTEPAVQVSKADQPFANIIHNIARQSMTSNLAAQYFDQNYNIDNLLNTKYDPNVHSGGQVMQPNFVAPLVLPKQFMHPLIVLLGAIKDTELNRRFVRSDLARIVSNKLRGSLAGTLRTLPDAELYHDLTQLKIDNFCSQTQMEDLAKRCNIHRHLKNEITALRSGLLTHGSYHFMNALRSCQQSPLQSFRPDNAVEMLYKVVNALAFYPTVVQELPNFVQPNAPIPFGEARRVPFLRVTLPRPGDNRFLDLATNKAKVLADGTVSPAPEYSILPDKVGKNSWVQTPWHTIHNSTMKIVDSRALIFVVDRRLPHVTTFRSPFETPEGVNKVRQLMTYADSYPINTSKIADQPMVELKFLKNKKFKLTAFLALNKVPMEGMDVSSGYKTYVKKNSDWYCYNPNELLTRSGAADNMLKVSDMNTMKEDKEKYSTIFLYCCEQ